MQARPNIEQLINESMDSKVDNPEDEDESPYDWNSLSEKQQEETEINWKSSNHDSYYNSEVEYWNTEQSFEDAQREVVYDFNEIKNQHWAADAIQQFTDEWGEESPNLPLPYTPEQLLKIMSLDDLGHADFDFSEYEQETQQMTLPGIPPPDNTTPKWLDKLQEVLETAFEEKVEDVRDHLDPPDYLNEQVDDALDDAWNNKADNDKFEWAKEQLDIEDKQQTTHTEVFKLPVKFDPLNLTNEQDYQRTQLFARQISLRRAAQLLVQRNIVSNAGMAHDAVKNTDRDLWAEWKDSSTSTLGLALQIATAEELGGRLRMEQNKKDQIIDRVNNLYPRVGGYEGIKAITRAKWETTQYMLDRAGHHVLNLYRSIRLDPSVLDNERRITVGTLTKLPDVVVLRNGAASTTVNKEIANGWGSSGDRIVLRLEVPRTAAISVPAFGQNVHSEQEVVVAGTAWSRWDVWRKTAPAFNVISMDETSAYNPEVESPSGTTKSGHGLDEHKLEVMLWP